MNPMRMCGRRSLIALGVLWPLDAADVVSADTVLDRWWPVAVIAAGPVRRGRGAATWPVGPAAIMLSTHCCCWTNATWSTSTPCCGRRWRSSSASGCSSAAASAAPRRRPRRELLRQDLAAVCWAGREGRNIGPQHFWHARPDPLVVGGATLDISTRTDPGASWTALACSPEGVMSPRGGVVRPFGVDRCGLRGLRDKTHVRTPRRRAVAPVLNGGDGGFGGRVGQNHPDHGD